MSLCSSLRCARKCVSESNVITFSRTLGLYQQQRVRNSEKENGHLFRENVISFRDTSKSKTEFLGQ